MIRHHIVSTCLQTFRVNVSQDFWRHGEESTASMSGELSWVPVC